MTREEAVLLLLGIQDSVDLMLQYKKDEFDRIRTQNLGDNFYIKYDKPSCLFFASQISSNLI